MARNRVLLLLVLAWALAMIVPDLGRLAHPLGSLGFYANSDGLIYDIAGPFLDRSASPAARAGVREYDRLDLQRMSCRPYDATTCANALGALGGIQYVLPGRTVTLDLAATPTREARRVTLVAIERPLNWVARLVLLLDDIAGIAVVLAAAWLVWKRPGPMSWGFFLYTVWFNPGQGYAFYAYLQQWPAVLIVQGILASFAQAAGYVGLLLFALRVPNDVVTARWKPLERALPWIFGAFALALLASYGYAFGYRTESLSRAVLLAGFAVDAGALAILLARRREQTPEDYQRMRWIVWGCAIGLPAFILAQLAQGTSLFDGLWGDGNPPYHILGLLFLANGIFCIFVIHALTRARVVNVAIPLRRATLLGFVLTVPALVLHEQVENIHEYIHLPEWAWLAVAVAAAFLISRLHEAGTHVADRFFNRDLDRAEAGMARALVTAAHVDDIDRLLANEPYRALKLASAATFRRSDADFGRYEDFNGWDAAATRTLRVDDPLLAPLPGGDPFSLDDTLNEPALPPGLKRPVLAVPIANRVQCYAVALYGPHASGADLDSYERALLGRIRAHAADRYAQLENQALRKRVEELERTLAARGGGLR